MPAKPFKPGDEVEVETADETIKGVLMPTPEMQKDIAILKLSSGYNIGIDRKKIRKISLVKKLTAATQATPAAKPKAEARKGLPRITILHTGGTIASKVDYRTGAVVARFSPQEILGMFPELKEIANFDSRLVSNMWSDDLRFEHFEIIAKAIEKEIKKGADGIIVGMGTDNLAVASAALSFILQELPVPVIFVGAQRSSDRGSSDAAMNLVCAAAFIAKTDFSEVAICMHETISDNDCVMLPACKTQKLHSSRRDAFKAVNDTPIARINYDTKDITFIKKGYNKKNPRRKIVIKPKMEKKVGLLKIHINMFPEQFAFYKGYKGLVIEGTGLGHTPGHAPNPYCIIHKRILPAIKKLIASGCVVVMTTQCLYGRVQMNVYNKGKDLLNIGVIPGKDMLPNTAFVKLAWLLANYPRQKVKALMTENLRGEINTRTEKETF